MTEHELTAEKIYNSSGVEVKMAVQGSLGMGYICPVCGLSHCTLDHCLRCGQPIVYEKHQLLNYIERYKNIDVECKERDAYAEIMGYDRDLITGEKNETFSEMRERLKNE